MTHIHTIISSILLLTLATTTMGYHVAVFMPCVSSHFRPHIGIIRKLIRQNHTVTSVVHQECHDHFHLFTDNHILVHNHGLVVSKPGTPFSSIITLNKILTENAKLHEDVMEYFQGNRVDVILSSLYVQSSCLIAEKFNLPLLYNWYSMGFMVHEKCPGCSYTGTVTLSSPLSSLNPSLFVIMANIYFTHFLTVFTYSATDTFNSERRKLGLKEIPLKFSMLYNAVRFPIIYQTYHPLVPPSISLPDGRWLVGHIPAEERNGDALSEEYTAFLNDQSLPVVFIAFGTIVKLQSDDLVSMYRQVSTQNVYRVIWSLKTSQQQQLSERLQFSNLDQFQSKLPSHVKVVSFAPQVKLLDSVSVKIFVSHGGYSSVLESVDSGVPLILHPVFADQPYNSNVMEEIGCGIVIKYLDELHSKILSVMENYVSYESCMSNAKERMSEAGGAPQVVSILERMSEHGYEGMSFEYLMDEVTDFYSSLFILISTLALPILLFVIICYVCCCRKRKKSSEKSKKE